MLVPSPPGVWISESRNSRTFTVVVMDCEAVNLNFSGVESGSLDLAAIPLLDEETRTLMALVVLQRRLSPDSMRIGAPLETVDEFGTPGDPV